MSRGRSPTRVENKKRGRPSKSKSSRLSYSGVKANGRYGRDAQRIYTKGYSTEEKETVVARLKTNMSPYFATRGTNVRRRKRAIAPNP